MAEQKQDSKKKGSDKSKQLGLGVDKTKEFSEWYSQVITKAELISYYDISGCYVLRPWSFSIWDTIRDYFDKDIKELGVQNCYFPLFVSERALKAEASHIEGFAPEVAWVTNSGKSKLKEPIAVRPTSETIMYPSYSNWIRSHRDLPLKLNQWVNVVRWEFKKPTPFIRTREFLWQEGHTAFSTLKEAAEEVMDILNLYKKVYEELLAVPVIQGKKTENEKFPGGHYTTTVEAFIPSSGRAIQAATSHCLGQNFAKMFKIEFENEKGEKELAWQNSWGLTTRSIGIMIMVHGDNKGLVLPPRVAPYQVVIVPIPYKDKDNNELKKWCHEKAKELKKGGIRVWVDDRETYTPGWKYNHWELKGVPLRFDVGPTDFEKQTVTIVRRDKENKEEGFKTVVAAADGEKLVAHTKNLIDEIHNAMFKKAQQVRNDRITKVLKWSEFTPALDKKNIVMAPWCSDSKCEDAIKDKSKQEGINSVEKHVSIANPNADKGEVAAEEEGVEALTGAAKSLCIPFDQPALPENPVCFHCGKTANTWCLFGRSY